ncbi:MAG TPA: helicase HerA-like domain-containing protein [Negativicutes bacterium]|nr:helicase HerA-like domain-containing protein [Negativicutes bacterium]
MYSDNKVWIAKGDKPVYLLPSMANRHGLIAGATGTGKTVTLKVMAEAFSDMGVPVFLTDIKGDLAGLAEAGGDSPKMAERLMQLGINDFAYRKYPVCFWDVFGKGGHPVRTTVSEMGALLLSRLLGLNDTQAGVLSIVFRVADEKGMLLLDLKDLRAMLKYVGDNAKDFTLLYGNIASQSIGAIQRSLMVLEDQGGASFFGEPALDIHDWMKSDSEGRGFINILHCVELFQKPALYSTFLLWMLSELFETLPETGDSGKPKLVFFFDEAHLLFEDTPKILLQKIEQVVRLIRSKGVGVYFITQNPMDIPEDVLGQLGNRVQHALRAYTPAEQKSVRAAAETFRVNPAFDTEKAITELATGEALVSCLDSEGIPGIVERAMILPPQSRFGTIDDFERLKVVNASEMSGKYDTTVDRESAYELLQAKVASDQAAETAEKERIELQKQQEKEAKERQKQLELEEKEREKEEKEREREIRRTETRRSSRKSLVERAADNVVGTIGREVGRSLIRGILGSLKR